MVVSSTYYHGVVEFHKVDNLGIGMIGMIEIALPFDAPCTLANQNLLACTHWPYPLFTSDIVQYGCMMHQAGIMDWHL